ncbi:nitrite reductase small subunit NirD [Corynebacterium kalidii]|jgi:nitrite reductase (NADH) small subunit|uniref:Nitrite reductase small subunit NirD n=1 Tax=Corynebacterium kalidii TaxID=2931982 RepID=A0A9X1WE43_9CORY|nr:nitrite reductase small subunit NirD [Corynebacterium kalidii]MCJ7857319.1 nitrite reductase small subunit NirD [Corynebacterium kalidii]
MPATTTNPTDDFVPVCLVDDLEENLGSAVLLDDGTQIALFRCDAAVYAVSNIDPYMGAAVISRGIVGDYDGEPTIASPLLKQRFRLTDGRSLEDDSHILTTYRVEIRDVDGTARVLLAD